MNLLTWPRILLRRWVVVLPVIVIVAIGAERSATHARASYVADGSLLLLAPHSEAAPQQASLQNPYVGFTGPIRATASVVAGVLTSNDARNIVVARGGTASYTVDVPPEGPLIDLRAHASTPDVAVRTIQVLSEDVGVRLAGLQDAAGTPRAQQITSEPLTSPTSATQQRIAQVRAVVGLILLGIPAALSVALLAEAWSRRRDKRAGAVGIGAPRDGAEADAPSPRAMASEDLSESSASATGRLGPLRTSTFLGVGLLIAAATWLDVVVGVVALAVCIVVVVVRSRADLASLVTGVFAVTLFVIPSRFTFGPFATTVPTIMGFVAVILLLGMKMLSKSEIGRGRQLAATGMLVYLGAVLVSYVGGHLRVLTELERRGSDRHLAVLVGFAGMMLLIADGIRSKARLDRLLLLAVGSAGAMAAVGILQFASGFDISRNLRPPGFKVDPTFTFILQRAGFRRVAGTAAHPIEFGVVCGVMLPLALYYALRGSSPAARNVARVSLVLLAVALPMALSRSGLVVLATVLIVLLPTMPSNRRLWVIVAVVLGVAGLYVASPTFLGAFSGLISGHVGQASLQARSSDTQRALVLAGHTPWLGRGYGTFDSSQYFVIDNLYVVTIVEVGIVGLAGLLFMFLSGWAAARTIRRVSDDQPTRDLAQTLAAMLAGGAMGGWGLDVLQYPMIGGVMFFVLGSIGALSRITGPPVALNALRRQRRFGNSSGPMEDVSAGAEVERPELQRA